MSGTRRGSTMGVGALLVAVATALASAPALARTPDGGRSALGGDARAEQATTGGVADFPRRDSRYHTYPEMVLHLEKVQAAHPDLVRLVDIGRSAEGRTLWAVKVSDHVAQDEAEPEILIDGLHHSQEYLGAEMALGILDLLVSRYGGTGRLAHRVTSVVDTREIWIVPMVNPDGLQYSLTGDPYRAWRKNRQPIPRSAAIGTDLNRNYPYRWGCCGSTSVNPASPAYRGAAPWSAPETAAMRDLVLSRVVDGRQQIRVAITFHTPGRLVLWPYAYTARDVPPDMTALDRRTFVALGTRMAASNGYQPLQWGDGRVVSGDSIDWLYGSQRIFAFLVELGHEGHIPDEEIGPEVRRNRGAVLSLLEAAACPYAAIGKADAYCGPFFDDLEIDRGWAIDPDGTDTATAGAWVRAVPKAGRWQQTTTSGRSALVTGRRSDRDVDGGTTTIRSPLINLPAGGATLRLDAWVALGADATAEDVFLVRLVGPGGEVLANALRIEGDGTAHAPAWTRVRFRIPAPLLGQDVAIELVATDGAEDSILEAGVDEVRVTAAG